MVFYTKYFRPVNDDEVLDQTVITERAGYIPAKQQIEALMYSGHTLASYRADQFDGETDEEAEENYDPTRDYGFDLVDSSSILSDIQTRRAASRDSKGDSGDKAGSATEPVSELKTSEEGTSPR